MAAGDPGLLDPLVDGLPHLRVEARWAAREEMACTIDDVLSRRTRALLRRAEAAATSAPAVADLLAADWGRPEEAVHREAAAFADSARRGLERAGVPLAGSASRSASSGHGPEEPAP